MAKEVVICNGSEVRVGDFVRLVDGLYRGATALVDAIEEDLDGVLKIHVDLSLGIGPAVTRIYTRQEQIAHVDLSGILGQAPAAMSAESLVGLGRAMGAITEAYAAMEGARMREGQAFPQRLLHVLDGLHHAQIRLREVLGS
jgi:hypothetical protein